MKQKFLPKVSVCLNKNEEISLVDVNQDLAKGELLYAYLNGTLRVLRLSEFIKCSVLLLYKKKCY